MNSKLNIIILIIGQVLSLRRERNILTRGINRFKSDRRGFGMNELLGIAAALIIAAFIIIPGFQTFTKAVMKGLSDWWRTTIADKIFPNSIT